MRSLLDRLNNPLHLLIALACTWLLASSPWVGLYDVLPHAPGLVNLSHVVLGLAMLPLGIVYLLACTVGGRWRLYFPWAAGQIGPVRADLSGVFRGERPGSEGGGLFAMIEGLLLLALISAALSGALWFAGQGSETAAVWRGPHIVAARGFAILLGLHVLAVSLHLVDLVRD